MAPLAPPGYVYVWNTCWATALRAPHELFVTIYINSALCVLERVDSISKSPGSVGQSNELRFGRNTSYDWSPSC